MPPLTGNENDHCGIHLPGHNITKQRVAVIRRKYDTASKNAAIVDIIQQDWEHVINSTSVDEMVENYQNTIKSVLDTHCPLVQKKVRADNPFFVTPLLDKITKARNRAHRNKHPSWPFLNKLARKLTRKSKRSYAAKRLNKGVGSKKWWQEIDRLEGKAKKELPNYHMMEGNWYSTAELVEKLNQYFSKVGGKRDGVYSTCANPPTCLSPVSYGEVRQLLKRINTRKSTHSDDLPTWLSKECADDLCVPVTHIINKMLESQQYPDLWKHAEVKPLQKVTNPTSPNEFRPIALLHHIGKIAEHVILDKLKSSVECKLDKLQFAYRKGHSTTDALLNLFHHWCSALDNPRTSHISTVMIDMSKAFDRMHPDLLVEKLMKLDVPDGLIQLTNNFLTNRSFRVALGNEKSTALPVTMGAPQGTKLGPWLWLVYINDLLPACKTIKYADDVTTYSVIEKESSISQSNLQDSLNYTSDWAVNNNMLLNSKKTQLMKISLSNPKIDDSYSLDSAPISTSQTSKLLGVTIDARLSFSDHVDDVVSRTSFKIHSMRRLKRLEASDNCLMTFFLAHVLSILTYASPAWSCLLSKSNTSKLEQIQRRCLKIIHPNESYQQNLITTALPTIEMRLNSAGSDYYQKIAYDESHPLHDIIVPNTSTRTLRMRRHSYVPKCRTSKFASSFFIKYAF